MTPNSYIDLPALQSVDSLPLRTTTMDMIDLDKVAMHITNATQRGRYRGPTDVHDYLLHRKCLALLDGQPIPTLAGILCFARQPQAILPRAVVDIGHYRGSEALSYEVVHLEKDISGTIFDQLSRVETYLWNNIHHGMTLAKGTLQRVEVHEYPEAVIRELIVNMLVHRDYTNFQSAARIFLFRNRIEWISPGGLPEGVTLDNLLSSQAARNPVVLRILYEAGYVEAIGQGLVTVDAELRRQDMLPPKFEDTGINFKVTVYGQSLDVISGVGSFADLTLVQRKILDAIHTRGEMSMREIRELLPDRAERSIQRDIKVLITAGLLVTSGSARSLRYRLSMGARA